MIYELRIYHVLNGKMREYSQHFAEFVPVWKKLGINLIGVWQTVIGENDEFTYLLAFDDMADRDKKWKAVAADPDTQAYFQKHPSGSLVTHITNKILTPQPYSPLK